MHDFMIVSIQNTKLEAFQSLQRGFYGIPYIGYFIAADVFVYIGDLSEIFSTIRSRSEVNALFAFCTEENVLEYVYLERTGRYSHSLKYIL